MPTQTDLKLIAAVQRLSGRRVHDAANLIHCYRLWGHLCNSSKTEEDRREALEEFEKSERELRQFLSNASAGSTQWAGVEQAQRYLTLCAV